MQTNEMFGTLTGSELPGTSKLKPICSYGVADIFRQRNHQQECLQIPDAPELFYVT